MAEDIYYTTGTTRKSLTGILRDHSGQCPLQYVDTIWHFAVLNYVIHKNYELFDSTESQSSELKDIWKKLNANVEETAELSNKVM